MSLFIRSETNHQSVPIALSGGVIFEILLYGHGVIVENSGTPFRKVSAICFIITIMVQFISLTFIRITLYWVSVLKFIYSTKIRNNTEDTSLGIPVESTEPKKGQWFGSLSSFSRSSSGG